MHKNPLNILLVEDDSLDARLVRLNLAKSRQPVHFTIETAENLADCLRCLTSRSFDLVLLDLGLPDSYGLETLDNVYQACPYTPIVVLTGTADEEMGIEAVKRGASDYLVKSKYFKDLLVRSIRYAVERKRAEDALQESEGKLGAMLGSIADHMSVMDKDLNIVWANEKCKKIFGSNIIGKKCYEVFHRRKEPCRPYPCIALKAFQDGKVHKHDTQVVDKDGNTFYFHCTANVALRDKEGKPTAAMEICRDITERKQAEQKQAQLLKEVQRANHELKDFAHIVSHDLKAPLRGIRTLANWISTDYGDKLGEQGREHLNLLSRRANRLHNLIKGVLQYSMVGRVREEKVQVDLNQLVSEVIDSLAPPESVTVTIEDKLPVIECEHTRIAQLFQNLLGNAVKYMDKPKGRVKIGCESENGFWKFSIADNGPGIREKDFERIFQIFQTLSRSDESESTGVGLTMVKKIVELYGGKIWVESQLRHGSTFFFTLPKNQAEGKNAELEANIACGR